MYGLSSEVCADWFLLCFQGLAASRSLAFQANTTVTARFESGMLLPYINNTNVILTVRNSLNVSQSLYLIILKVFVKVSRNRHTGQMLASYINLFLFNVSWFFAQLL